MFWATGFSPVDFSELHRMLEGPLGDVDFNVEFAS